MLLLIIVVLLTSKVDCQNQECDFLLRNSTGVITSLDVDNDGLYENGLHCMWAIFASENKVIELVILEMDIEFEDSCTFDYLKVIDGEFQVGIFCGTEIPEPIVSEARQMLLIFRSDDFIQRKGFRASYRNLEDERCGYRVSQIPGSFGSLDYDSDGLYDSNSSCVWSVTRPYYYPSFTTVLLQLYLTDLDIQEGDDCQFDYIEVFDNMTLIGRYCGSTQPPVITSSSDLLEIHFEADGSTNGGGFTAYYSDSNPTGDCGGVLIERTGEIHSMDIDGYYPADAYCQWLIVGERDAVIELTFLTFELEADSACKYDAVLVYDDVTTFRTKNLIGRFCGHSLPNPIRSSTHVLTLQFESDGSDNYRGFSARYTQIKGDSCVYLKNGLSGRFGPDDIDLDGLYDNNLNCTWDLNVRSNDGLVQIYITDMDIQHSENCQLDYVEVLENGTSVGRYCGSSQPPVITSSSNTLEISFTSDGNINGRGFIAYYTLTDLSGECGGILTEQTGEITSVDRDGDGYYDFNLECRWLIIAENGSLVELKFPHFRIEYDSTCFYDYVAIYDGDFGEDDLIGYYCGSNIPYVILSTTNVVRVHFSTDANNAFSGFHTTYMIVKERTCSSQYTNMPGRFGPPDSDSDGLYDPDFSCTWYVFGSGDKLMQIYLTDLDIEESDNCQHDYIEIIYNSSSAVRYCGSAQPPVITSATNAVEIRFESNGNVNGKGFTAYYAETDSTGICGGILTEPVGGIASLTTGTGNNFQYEHDLDCRWLIVADKDYMVDLQFLTFDLESDTLCRYDYVTIHDGAFPDEDNIVGSYCGRDIPLPVISSTNVLCVRFTTDGLFALTGFTASYKQVKGPICGYHVVEMPGRFGLPEYNSDGLYKANLRCTWTFNPRYIRGYGNVRDSAEKQVQIYLTDLGIQPGDSCQFDYIEVLENGMSVGRYCGSTQPPLITSNASLEIRFHSDDVISGRGFTGYYTDTYMAGECGGILTEPTGKISSINRDWDGLYDDDLFCRWLIVAEKGSLVELSFRNFDLEDTFSCTDDYVAVYDGVPSDENDLELLGRFCGSRTPMSLRSSTNVLYVEFKSDVEDTLTGFNATYMHFKDNETTTQAKRITDVTNRVNTYSTMSSYTEEMTDVFSSVDPASTTTDASVLETTKRGTTNTEAITNQFSNVSTHLTPRMVTLDNTQKTSTESFVWTSVNANTAVTTESESTENNTRNTKSGTMEITETISEGAAKHTTDVGPTLETVSEPTKIHTDTSHQGITEPTKTVKDNATQDMTTMGSTLESTDNTTLTSFQPVGSAEKIEVTYISQYLPFFACILGLLQF